jgi:hypothetical protein
MKTPNGFIPTRERPCPRMNARGVYRASVLDAGGNPIVQAVDSRHRVVCAIPCSEDRDVDTIVAAVWRLLNDLDPEHEAATPLSVVAGADAPTGRDRRRKPPTLRVLP